MSGMKLKATSGGGQDFEIPESGPQPAVLVAIIDIGTHEKSYGGDAKVQTELYLAWELPGAKMTGMNRNHVLPRVLTKSLHVKSGLYKLITQWRGSAIPDGEDFDVEKLLGQPCQLNVAHEQSKKGRTFAKVEGVTKLMKGVQAPAATLKPVFYVLDRNVQPPSDNWLPFTYDLVKSSFEWLGKPIPTRGESGGTNGERQPGDEDAESPPF